MTWASFFRKPRCMECKTTSQLHLVEDGMHKGYVCSRCAVVSGYVYFLPSLAHAIIEESKETRTS